MMGKKYVMLCMVGISGHNNVKRNKKAFYDKNRDQYISAEAQSTCLWAHGIEKGSELHMYLFPSDTPESRETAGYGEKDIYMRYTAGELSNLDTFNVKEVCPLDIKVDNKENFFKSFALIFDTFDDRIKKERKINPECEIIINATGGYKAIAAYAGIYAQLHNFKSIYAFEQNISNSDEIVILPPLPISYSLKMMDDEIAMLKCIHKSPEVFTGIDTNTLPEWLHGFFNVKSGKVHPLAQALVREYDRQKNNVEIGAGLMSILEETEEKCGIHNKKYSGYLRGRINNQWSDLWLGDQIPETVEHSRRHSKRLMEICANIIRAATDDMRNELGLNKPQNIALLTASFFLHDIGHTVVAYPFAAPGKAFSKELVPIGKFPSCVREVHHLLSSGLVTTCSDHYFPKNDDVDENVIDMFRTLVPKICDHHRQYMSLGGGNADYTGTSRKRIHAVSELLFGKGPCEFERPLETRLSDIGTEKLSGWGVKIEEILKIAALLRFIDACDVQMDRTAGKKYMATRQYRTKEEALCLYPILEALENKNGIIPLPAEARVLYDVLKNINTDQVKLDEDTSTTIKENCNPIYEKVLERLLAIKGEAKICAVTAENALEIEFLSTLNRFAFKCEQFRHFYKHSCVDFVFPTLSNGHIVINLWPNYDVDNDKEAVNKSVNGIREDIEKEYSGVRDFISSLNITCEPWPTGDKLNEQ